MFLKIRELTHMEGAQLGQGFDPEPGRGLRKIYGSRQSLFASAWVMASSSKKSGSPELIFISCWCFHA